MAIDTVFKRRSAAAARRMPWMRRFGVPPDATIDQGDRQLSAWVYGGIEAAVELVTPAESFPLAIGAALDAFSVVGSDTARFKVKGTSTKFLPAVSD